MISNFSDTQLETNQIPGVEFKELKSFPDDRGFFRELVRVSDPFFHATEKNISSAVQSNPIKPAFAQWSHSKMGRNTVKAWHFHHQQVDWWYVPIGVIHTALVDNRTESPTYRRKIEFCLGDRDEDPTALVAVVRIPQGVLHGCRVLSDIAHLFYITSETYNPQDEGRLPFNAPEIEHVWGKEDELIVAPNDRRLFIPPHPREGGERITSSLVSK